MADDLMPHQEKATTEEVGLAYKYVDSVVHTADHKGSLLWHGWAIREAFLAGMHAQNSQVTRN